jgi:hypothetical protein
MRIAIILPLALATFVALPAAAQLPGNALNQGGDLSGLADAPGGFKAPPAEKKTSLPPPAAVPGAKARPDSVTPYKGGTNDLPPTEALFDAINRGDILTARDAINRGADLDSTNLLGLTPIELSVDLGRNDISFLLLSLRGAPGSVQASRQPADSLAASAPPLATDRRGRRSAVTAVASTSVGRPIREAPPSPARAPVLFAGNGGAPVPAAGFLGFDPRQ